MNEAETEITTYLRDAGYAMIREAKLHKSLSNAEGEALSVVLANKAFVVMDEAICIEIDRQTERKAAA